MSGVQTIDNPGWVDATVAAHASASAMATIDRQLSNMGELAPLRSIITGIVANPANRSEQMEKMRARLEAQAAPVNAIAKAFRANARKYQTTSEDSGHAASLPTLEDLAKGGAPEISKSVLDIGTATNFATITGGQSLGYVSLDTQMARGTVRPGSFTLYQALKKSPAMQVVDYWAYVDDTGGAIPGAAFAGFNSVTSGALQTNVGKYSLQNVTLKMMLDGRAMTVALASQNSFADIPTQESANAALTILSTADYACYYGNSTLFPNQFNGLANTIPAANKFDFQVYQNGIGTKNSWTASQALYNLIYQAAGQITSWATFGRITHAFMSPAANASLQELVTTVLNNVLSLEGRQTPGIVVNGDLQGMRTRFGAIQFVLDLFIDARLAPAQSIIRADGTTPATTVAPTPPANVTTTVQVGPVTGSAWTAAYTTSPSYVYAVASLDTNSNESQLTYSPVVSTIAAGGSVTLSVSAPGANDAAAYRVYRSGNGYAKTGGANTPYSFRHIVTVAANGSTAVPVVDLNAVIPGGETIFLLDLAEEDNALDFRFLLPLTKIELYAQNLYMPWAVTMIGALRNRIPKFHGMIFNYVPDEPSFNPLSANN